MRHLRKSFEEAENPVSKADNACHLAIAHDRSGRLDEACKYLDLARQLHPNCPLLSRVELELAGRPVIGAARHG